jgi:hypothetical protein
MSERILGRKMRELWLKGLKENFELRSTPNDTNGEKSVERRAMSMEFELEKVGSWRDKILHTVLLKIEP